MLDCAGAPSSTLDGVGDHRDYVNTNRCLATIYGDLSLQEADLD